MIQIMIQDSWVFMRFVPEVVWSLLTSTENDPHYHISVSTYWEKFAGCWVQTLANILMDFSPDSATCNLSVEGLALYVHIIELYEMV